MRNFLEIFVVILIVLALITGFVAGILKRFKTSKKKDDDKQMKFDFDWPSHHKK